MEIELFPIRTKSLSGESLWSFLIRLSLRNGISILSLLNSIRNWDKRYVQKADWGLLDFSPESMLDFERLSQLSGNSAEDLLTMTFHNILVAFGCGGDAQRSRFMSGMLSDYYQFCPQCLKENIPYHRLLWRLKNITGCITHRPLTQ